MSNSMNKYLMLIENGYAAYRMKFSKHFVLHPLSLSSFFEVWGSKQV